MARTAAAMVCLLALGMTGRAAAQVPHGQDRPPGPALSPTEAIAKMQVPPGFKVELFASEPDLVNPVAMTFDERGRVWVTESLEYPRYEAGPGRDRIKILEDTNQDGKADKVTIFADGLNIPSGIALGYGGAFVANAPDILFLKDTDGDGKADHREVLFTGFGRDDTHELPSCLTWGPDGWLYGLNGVFNPSLIKHQGKTHSFTCALWRYHPRTKKFELFAEGTSNPWGLDYDSNGSFFVSACVIDHLWHLTESGYYHRQGGPYPPYTWKIESIVDHKHQKAAYCGFCVYQANTYPEEYRGKLFMGNIHGNCINSDQLERNGASYFARPRPDFLTANDAWFMPVVQKVGPDGCLWILDWYDRYHCYQDARRDPEGIDRLKGRLYRVTYQGTKMPPPFDLAKQSDAELIKLLGHPNMYYRRYARLLLTERGRNTEALERLVLDDAGAIEARTEALWTLVSQGPLKPQFHRALLKHENSTFRAWAVRAAGEMRSLEPSIREQVVATARDPQPDVRLQAAIAARKIESVQPMAILMEVLARAADDRSELTPRIVWQNLNPLLDKETSALVEVLSKPGMLKIESIAELLPRLLDRLVGGGAKHAGSLLAVAGLVLETDEVKPSIASTCVTRALEAILQGELGGQTLATFRERFGSRLVEWGRNGSTDPRLLPGLGFAVLFDDRNAHQRAIAVVADRKQDPKARILLLTSLLHGSSHSDDVIQTAVHHLNAQSGESLEFQVSVLNALSRSRSSDLGKHILAVYPTMRVNLGPQALDLLTSRPAWAKALMAAIANKKVDHSGVNVNQIRKMINLNDQELSKLVHATWGQIRTDRNPEREKLVADYRRLLQKGRGNANEGAKVFQKVCAQCHKIHGEGFEVGPDLTYNGRTGLDQILSNVLDPNLVIGTIYQARRVLTTDGRVVSGLLVEDSPTRVVLKIAGGKQEVIARSDVEEMQVDQVSLMPEGLEKQITEQEFRDLIAFLLVENRPAEK